MEFGSVTLKRIGFFVFQLNTSHPGDSEKITHHFLGPEGDTVTMVEQLLNTEY